MLKPDVKLQIIDDMRNGINHTEIACKAAYTLVKYGTETKQAYTIARAYTQQISKCNLHRTVIKELLTIM